MGSKPVKILLVEDNPDDAILFEEMINDESSLITELEHAENMQNALEKISSIKFDIVFLDLGLPESQGLETFLRFQKEATNLPVIVLTGLQDEDIALEALKMGAQDYLVKGQVDVEHLFTVFEGHLAGIIGASFGGAPGDDQSTV